MIKAAHVYIHLTGDSSAWAGSAACRLIDAIVLAAILRLPGYAEAAGHWTRPPPRPGAPIGLRWSWTLVDHGVTWVPPVELAQRWEGAALVLLAANALGQLPTRLPPRPGIYLCALREIGRSVAGGHPPQLDVVVLLPAGPEWLLDQLTAPAAALQSSRITAAGASLR